LYEIIGLTIIAGVMSGLTVGYLSIDGLVLELKMKNGSEQEKKDVYMDFIFCRLKQY